MLSSMFQMNLIGWVLLPAMQEGGISRLTADPAALVQPHSSVMPDRIVTLQPIHTFFDVVSLSNLLGLLVSVISVMCLPSTLARLPV